MLDTLLAWLQGLPTLPTYGVLALLSALENVFPPVPADVAVALGAFLAQRGEISAPVLGVVCWAANQVSAAAVYWLARVQGEAFLRSRLARMLMPEPAVLALRQAYDRHGMAGIFLSRFLPGVRAAVLPFAGLMGLSPARALVPCAVASGIWYTLLVLAGSALGLSWPAVRGLLDDANRVLGLLGLVSAVAVGWWLYRRAAARPAA